MSQTSPGAFVGSHPSAIAPSSQRMMSLAMKASFISAELSFRSSASTRSRIGYSSLLFHMLFSSRIRQ